MRMSYRSTPINWHYRNKGNEFAALQNNIVIGKKVDAHQLAEQISLICRSHMPLIVEYLPYVSL